MAYLMIFILFSNGQPHMDIMSTPFTSLEACEEVAELVTPDEIDESLLTVAKCVILDVELI